MSREVIQKMHEQQVSGGYVVILRIFLGIAFLTTWITNLLEGVFTGSGFVGTISYFFDHPDHVATPLDSIIRDFVFPNAVLFGLGWLIIELFISLSLTFGVLTRLGSIVGASFTVILGLGSLGVEWIWTQPLLFVGFVTCGLISAGKWYGVDYWLKDRIPEKFVRFVI
ncbi:MAG: DoxX family membrane protein [Candidatus Hodarchaeales archaeon]|jgi:uncharacterized membrane protein YphA (DoxX/SURF4 family)